MASGRFDQAVAALDDAEYWDPTSARVPSLHAELCAERGDPVCAQRNQAKARVNLDKNVLACMTFPKGHRAKIDSTNPIERLNGEIRHRIEVVGIFANEEAITRLVGAILLEQTDEWAVHRARCMSLPGESSRRRRSSPMDGRWD